MHKTSLVFIAGYTGLVGSAIVRKLQADGYTNLLLKTQDELNLENQFEVIKFFAEHKPEYVFLSAAKVGGILANNTYPADFIYSNLMIQTNVIHAAYQIGVKRLIFLGSSCIYPKLAPQPLKEEYLLTGKLEATNESYAIAKIAGIKMCEAYNRQYGVNFISIMPTNLYGPNDNFDLQTSHVLPAMIRKFHDAKLSKSQEIFLWGTGAPKREFLHVDDLASACVLLMELDEKNLTTILFFPNSLVNVGVGEDMSIKELAELIKKIVGYNGEVKWDTTKPDGTSRKVLDVSKICSLGWTHKINIEQGIIQVYQWYLNKSNYEL